MYLNKNYSCLASKVKSACLFVLFAMLLSTQMIGQDRSFSSESLTLESDQLVQVDIQKTPSFSYELSSPNSVKMDFQSIAELKEKYNSPLTTILYSEKSGKISLHLELRSKPDWTAADWNKYLRELYKSNN